MKLESIIKVPTGEIYTASTENGVLEFLTVGDYGKDANIKADFLGITRELNGVPNGDIMPLSEKWVITISTQYGCSMNCKFCDVPKVGPGRNISAKDLRGQIQLAIQQHPEVLSTKRLNIHYARMGEPTFNHDVLINAANLPWMVHELLSKDTLIHPVVSTMLPKNNTKLEEFLHSWVFIKNELYNGNAGLQFSINSTDNEQRNWLFSGNSLNLEEISELGKWLPNPIGRKYALNFALSDQTILDANRLRELFDPKNFMVKITPLHVTHNSTENHIVTTGGYDSFTPYKDVEQSLKDVGFDVIVFVPSYDEDLGLITCGNAILSGSEPKVPFVKIIK